MAQAGQAVVTGAQPWTPFAGLHLGGGAFPTGRLGAASAVVSSGATGSERRAGGAFQLGPSAGPSAGTRLHGHYIPDKLMVSEGSAGAFQLPARQLASGSDELTAIPEAAESERGQARSSSASRKNGGLDKRDSMGMDALVRVGSHGMVLRSRSSALKPLDWLVDPEPQDSEGEGTAAATPEASPDHNPEPAAAAAPANGGRKRLGRPVSYGGDPNSASLSEEDRRKLKRRIANRESARRVRQKRQELLDELQIKCTTLSHTNTQLLGAVAALEHELALLLQQMALLKEQCSLQAAENGALHGHLYQLRKVPADALQHAERQLATHLPQTTAQPQAQAQDDFLAAAGPAFASPSGDMTGIPTTPNTADTQLHVLGVNAPPAAQLPASHDEGISMLA